MLNEQLTSYFPSEYFIMIALIIGLGLFSDGKKNVGEYYFIQWNVENDIFGKGKTKNVVDAKSIEEIFFPFSVLSEFYLILYSAVAPITLWILY